MLRCWPPPARLAQPTTSIGRWANPNSRMIKMFMTPFRLSGWQGGVREPCRMPPAAELEEFRTGLLRLGVHEFEQLARQSPA